MTLAAADAGGSGLAARTTPSTASGTTTPVRSRCPATAATRSPGGARTRREQRGRAHRLRQRLGHRSDDECRRRRDDRRQRGLEHGDPQPVSLTATGGHGALTVHYVLDGGTQADVSGDASFDVTATAVTRSSTGPRTRSATRRPMTPATSISTRPVRRPPTTTPAATPGRRVRSSFSLTAADATSGVDGTSWNVDGGSAHSGTDVLVTGDGEHTVTYSSTDVAGHHETPHSVTVRIDAGAPATGDDAPPAGASATRRSRSRRSTRSPA